eukprot:CAMPEP_0183328436 /NCGR_PEP_ID=MMETSP0160_2-20130417/84278_1 /TAXON_ID=2839 ORGANISM="Odontella Sinensis, Strain Grunow 1884" /NCGR_SAMPLE_ID=MMETSP0160_2 /ASSEMBLY_ACC=CAM_ASM_000250 /LENGTH=550 /DNA_ID=CAMNT_0025496595 /DNA_START=32 /DNA_END=1684 /DNA_ORIENTATION=+
MGNSPPLSRNDDSAVVQTLLITLNDKSAPLRDRREAFLSLRSRLVRRAGPEDLFRAIAKIDERRFELWATDERVLHGDGYSSGEETGGNRNAASSASALSDMIRGLAFGAAVGDAVGLNTEFLSKRDVERHYGKDASSFRPGMEDIYPDSHRIMWTAGDWTDDTDQAIIALISLLNTAGVADRGDFAARILDWHRRGFPDLGDEGGAGLGASTKKVLLRDGFEEDPHGAALSVWEGSGRKAAANGAVMRTAVVGVPFYWDDEMVTRNALEICKVTHADPRCQASCVLISVLVAGLLRNAGGGEARRSLWAASDRPAAEHGSLEAAAVSSGERADRFPVDLRCLPTVVHAAVDQALASLEAACREVGVGQEELEEYREELLKYIPPFFGRSGNQEKTASGNSAMAGTWQSALLGSKDQIERMRADNDRFLKDTLNLEEIRSIGYTFKCMGAALWGLAEVSIMSREKFSHRKQPADEHQGCHFSGGNCLIAHTIQRLVREGGDADTNAVVCSALLGCVCGYSNLPHGWIAAMPYSNWLEAWIQKLLVVMQLK